MSTLRRCSASLVLDFFSSVSGWNEAEDGIPAEKGFLGIFYRILSLRAAGLPQHLSQGHEWEWERQVSFPRTQQSPAVPN